MKGRVIQIIVLLLLGAIVNVAVAWGCVARFRFNYRYMPQTVYVGGEKVERTFTILRATGRIQIESLADPDLIENNLSLLKPPLEPSAVVPVSKLNSVIPHWYNDTEMVEAAGWPLLTLWGGTDFLPEWPGDDSAFRDRYGWRHHPLFSRSMFARGALSDESAIGILPLRPIWPGFAINTIFYAAILWVVWFVPGMVRRRIRRRRGLCPACAYPVGTSNVCTECGNHVTRKCVLPI